MINWMIFVAFYLALSVIVLCLLYLLVKALIAIIRMEKNMRELTDLLVQSENNRQKEQLRQ